MPGTRNNTEYQLVVEFAESGPDFFRRVADLELLLNDQLESGEVDGNDVGPGVINLFVITKQPEECFQELMNYFEDAQLELSAAAYRDSRTEAFTRLWPANDQTVFELK